MRFTRRSFIHTGAVAGALTVVGAKGLIRPVYAQDKNVVNFAAAGAVTSSWNPASHTVAPQITAEGFIFSRLVDAPMRPDNPEELLPDLALSWELIDPYTLEYKLREGVKFHDGSDFTAEDVKATFEYASRPENPASAWYPGPVDVEVVDPYTVRLKTEKYGYPAHNFWYVVAFLPIMSAKDIADPSSLDKRPNGTGPFKYVETKGDQIIFEGFEDYYDGRPEIDVLNWIYVPDANTRVLGLLNGEYHIAERLEPEQYLSLQDEAGLSTVRGLSSENKYIHFRSNKPPFDDVRVRLAATHSIDREQLLDIVGVAAEPAGSHLSPVKFGYIDLPDYPAYDPGLAQQYLAEAGYPGGEGLPEIEYITSVGFYPKTREYSELIAAMLQEQGFPVTLTTLEPASWEQQLYRRSDGQGPGHIVDVGWLTGSPEPDLILRPNYYSEHALVNGLNDPDIDAVLDKERNAESLEERLQILQEETLPLIAQRSPSVSLFSSVFLWALSDELDGVYFYPNGPIDLRKAKFTK